MLRRLSVICILAAGCGGAQPPADTASAAPPAEPPEPVAPAEPVASAADCGPDIAGVEPLLVPGTIVMLGEMHGTNEMPALAGDLACRAAVDGHRVLLGLEIPRGEQPAIDRYLTSDGSAAAREALLRGKHWHPACPDGRSSTAMLALVEQMRALRQRGLAVDVLAFDMDAYDSWNQRDEGMAAAILAGARARPDAIVLTLSGNLHNRIVPGAPWDESLVPMGVHVVAAHQRVVSLDVRHSGGTAWIQTGASECGVNELPGKPAYQERYVDTSEAAGNEFGHGIGSVGAITAAPPAARAP